MFLSVGELQTPPLLNGFMLCHKNVWRQCVYIGFAPIHEFHCERDLLRVDNEFLL